MIFNEHIYMDTKYIPRERVPDMTRSEVRVKNEIRFGSWFWENHGEVYLLILKTTGIYFIYMPTTENIEVGNLRGGCVCLCGLGMWLI